MSLLRSRPSPLTRFVAVAAALVVPLAACSATTGGPGGTTPHGSAQPSSRTIPFFGLDVPRADPVELARVSGVLGCRPSVVSMFVKLDTPFDARRLSGLAMGGATPFLTLEPWYQRMRPGQVHDASLSLRSVASGTQDRALARIAAVIAAYPGAVYLRYAHEMNGDWYPWSARANGGDPAAYVAAWRHVHTLFDRAGVRNVRWVWSPAALPTGPSGVGGELESQYPGDEWVDYVGFSGYAKNVPSARETFAPWLADVARFTNRPVVLAEIGADGAHKSDWIASLADYIESTPRIAGFVWFNTTPASTGATGYYRIDDNPRQATAFRTVLTRLHVRCTPTASTPTTAPGVQP